MPKCSFKRRGSRPGLSLGLFRCPTDELVTACSPELELAVRLPARSHASHLRRTGLLCWEGRMTGKRPANPFAALSARFRVSQGSRLRRFAASAGRGAARAGGAGPSVTIDGG